MYVKLGVGDTIRERFGEQLRSKPDGADDRENETWYIIDPVFKKKEGQRVYWGSRIKVEAKAFKTKTEWPTGDPSRTLFVPGSGTAFVPAVGNTIQTVQGTTLGSYQPLNPSDIAFISTKKRLVSSGHTMFEVVWSASVTTGGTFRTPRIDSIDHIETLWD